MYSVKRTFSVAMARQGSFLFATVSFAFHSFFPFHLYFCFSPKLYFYFFFLYVRRRNFQIFSLFFIIRFYFCRYSFFYRISFFLFPSFGSSMQFVFIELARYHRCFRDRFPLRHPWTIVLKFFWRTRGTAETAESESYCNVNARVYLCGFGVADKNYRFDPRSGILAVLLR